MNQTISLLNMKGGVGKTTLAVNLAWYMHRVKNKNVLLVDLDPQFNATQYVMAYEDFADHKNTKGTIADLLIDHPVLSPKKKKILMNPSNVFYRIEEDDKKRFDLLPAELNLAWVVKNPAQMDYKLERLLSNIRNRYDYIFIDCAPTDSVLTTMALTASDFLLIPMRPEQFSLFGYANLLNTLDTFRRNCPDPHNVRDLGIVFTQVMEKTQIEADCIRNIQTEAKRQKGYVFKSQFKYSTSFTRSLKDQTPIFHTQYTKTKSRDLAANVAAEMENRITELLSTP